MIRLIILLLFTFTISFGQRVVRDKNYNIAYDSIEVYNKPVVNAKQLLKAGVGIPLFRQSSVSSASIWKSLGLDITLEYKLGSALAITGGLENNYSFSQYAQLYSVEMPIGFRYYFSLGKNMKSRTNPHSFFSHYISFQTNNVLFSSLFYDTPNPNVERYYRGRFLDHTTNVGKYSEAFNLLQHAYFQVGSQFKISINNYLDVNIVVPISNLIYHKTQLTLSTPSFINLKYGVAWQK